MSLMAKGLHDHHFTIYCKHTVRQATRPADAPITTRAFLMKKFKFLTSKLNQLIIRADDQEQAWEIFESKGFMRSECLAIR